METWPDLFVKNETYIDYKWDLSDFEEKDFLFYRTARFMS